MGLFWIVVLIAVGVVLGFAASVWLMNWATRRFIGSYFGW